MMSAMILQLIFVVIFLVESATSQACEHGRYYSHPTDCQLFYHCDSGVKIPKQCGGGTVFNRTTQVCDWPYNVDCTATGDFTCPNGFTGFVGAPNDCKVYYVCSNGVVSSQLTCPAGQYFRTDFRVCGLPSTLSQADRQRCLGNQDFTCPNGFTGFVGAPNDCTVYYDCRNGVMYTRLTCPAGQYFRMDARICGLPSTLSQADRQRCLGNQDCSDGCSSLGVVMPQNSNYCVAPTNSDVSRCGMSYTGANPCQSVNGFVADFSDRSCQYYFQCSNNALVMNARFKCYGNLFFNFAQSTCTSFAQLPEYYRQNSCNQPM